MITATLLEEILQSGVLYGLGNLVHCQHGSPQIDMEKPESWHLELGGGETLGLQSVLPFQRIIVWFLAAMSITSELLHLQLQTSFSGCQGHLSGVQIHAQVYTYIYKYRYYIKS